MRPRVFPHGRVGGARQTDIAHMEPAREQVGDEIHNELLKSFPRVTLVPVIADLRLARRIAQVFDRFHPDTVFHAAAHKHVPLMEENVVEAITNNILGTNNLVEVAAQATGRNFLSVRFGNVLGSRGSVIPTFLRQIEAGGPVTVTHPEMRRYFMTIPEAVQLVLQAGALGKSGELFALDMGDPDNWDALRIQLRALVPDFHVPPPPPPAEDTEHRPPATSGETRRLHLA